MLQYKNKRKKIKFQDAQILEIYSRINQHYEIINYNQNIINELVEEIASISLTKDLESGNCQSITVSNGIIAHKIEKKLYCKIDLFEQEIKKDYVDMPDVVRECFVERYELDLKKYHEIINIQEYKSELIKYVKENKPKLKYSIRQKKNFKKKRVDGAIEALKEEIELENNLRGY